MITMSKTIVGLKLIALVFALVFAFALPHLFLGIIIGKYSGGIWRWLVSSLDVKKKEKKSKS